MNTVLTRFLYSSCAAVCTGAANYLIKKVQGLGVVMQVGGSVCRSVGGGVIQGGGGVDRG